MAKVKRFDLEWVIEPEVRRYCGPIFFTTSVDEAEGNVIANGSFGLVETDTKKLLVTCSHVWDEFQKARSENPKLQMCICLDHKNPVIFSPDMPVGHDIRLDVVTFDMTLYLEACQGREFYKINQNPPPRVVTGDALFFIGFPGHLRHVAGEAIGFGRSPFAVRVHSVDDWRIHSDLSNLEIPQNEFGGISGCPCFLVRPKKPIQLIGFATQIWKEYLCFTHAKCLNADGTINPAPFKSN